MPTYEYKCSACGHTFERFQSITAEPIKRCPECGKAKVKRLLGTGAGVIFKGSGFYTTDYRSESYKEAAKSDSGGTGGDTKKDSGGTSEAKPAAAAASEPKPATTSESKPAAEPKASSSAAKANTKSKPSK